MKSRFGVINNTVFSLLGCKFSYWFVKVEEETRFHLKWFRNKKNLLIKNNISTDVKENCSILFIECTHGCETWTLSKQSKKRNVDLEETDKVKLDGSKNQ